MSEIGPTISEPLSVIFISFMHEISLDTILHFYEFEREKLVAAFCKRGGVA